ncbi:hypothetical protein ACRALDRAFT_211401 [Sodiomyces alcalophilus JCM 7366]|uniref:uncharacterized protein n=1 Tax=Sodiomyces alcalophilus JCM 7366 TaxID=591952 RepID=UPI0039B3F58F
MDKKWVLGPWTRFHPKRADRLHDNRCGPLSQGGGIDQRNDPNSDKTLASGPRTLFKGVNKLLPGHWIEITEDQLQIHRYRDAEYEDMSMDRAAFGDKGNAGAFRDLLYVDDSVGTVWWPKSRYGGLVRLVPTAFDQGISLYVVRKADGLAQYSPWSLALGLTPTPGSVDPIRWARWAPGPDHWATSGTSQNGQCREFQILALRTLSPHALIYDCKGWVSRETTWRFYGLSKRNGSTTLTEKESRTRSTTAPDPSFPQMNHYTAVIEDNPNATLLLVNHGWPGSSFLEFGPVLDGLTESVETGEYKTNLSFNVVIPLSGDSPWSVGTGYSQEVGWVEQARECLLLAPIDYGALPWKYMLWTRTPNTIDLTLYDSPVGQLAWIGEKHMTNHGKRSDPSAGVPPSVLTRREILPCVCLYYLTHTFLSSVLLTPTPRIPWLSDTPIRKCRPVTTAPMLLGQFQYKVGFWPRQAVEKEYDDRNLYDRTMHSADAFSQTSDHPIGGNIEIGQPGRSINDLRRIGDYGEESMPDMVSLSRHDNAGDLVCYAGMTGFIGNTALILEQALTVAQYNGVRSPETEMHAVARQDGRVSDSRQHRGDRNNWCTGKACLYPTD